MIKVSQYYGEISKVKRLAKKDFEDLGLENESEFEDLIEDILIKLTSHINTRLKEEEIDVESIRYPALCDIAERKVLDMISVIQQIQTGDIVRIDELSTHIINTTNAIEDLDDELKHFKESKVRVSWT